MFEFFGRDFAAVAHAAELFKERAGYGIIIFFLKEAAAEKEDRCAADEAEQDEDAGDNNDAFSRTSCLRKQERRDEREEAVQVQIIQVRKAAGCLCRSEKCN